MIPLKRPEVEEFNRPEAEAAFRFLLSERGFEDSPTDESFAKKLL